MIRLTRYPTSINMAPTLNEYGQMEFVVSADDASSSRSSALLLIKKEPNFDTLCVVPNQYVPTYWHKKASKETENILRYVESVRILIYRTNLIKHCLKSDVPWERNKETKLFRQVFQLELKNLVITLRSLVESLPGPNSTAKEISEWKNITFNQWLQISFYIKPFQCEDIDWKDFVKKGGVFEKEPHELGE
jgi:hypothetical protein